jgi:hypothetical protein
MPSLTPLREISNHASCLRWTAPPSRLVPLPAREGVRGLGFYRFFLAFLRDSLVFACSLDFFRLRRRLISFCRSLAI